MSSVEASLLGKLFLIQSRKEAVTANDRCKSGLEVGEFHEPDHLVFREDYTN